MAYQRRQGLPLPQRVSSELTLILARHRSPQPARLCAKRFGEISPEPLTYADAAS
jgi:hypothetical protein